MNEFWEGNLQNDFHSLGATYIIDFSDLIGAVIIDMGFHTGGEEEGGFAIDYMKDDEKKRIVLGFTELGMWKSWQGKIGVPQIKLK